VATFLLRYGEIALKGQNQGYFLETLVRNVRRALEALAPATVDAVFGRIRVDIDAPPGIAAEHLRRVFGVVSLSPVEALPLDLDEIIAAAVRQAGATLARRPETATFKIDTRRADKMFPIPSMDLSSRVGEAVGRAYPHLRARMRHPDLVVRIELRDRAYVGTEVIAGPGGLPTGTGGRALALLSGGIDSPVAAWLAARRGVLITPVHFHSFPFTSERSKEKVVDLCRVLASYAGELALWVVHFTEIQRAIQRTVPDALRVLVMRRMMMRVCAVLAAREGALALVTGESVGQVASQTLESIAVINEPIRLPVLRPLIGADKTEIVARAEAIGTYPISIRPYEDCCSLFVPAHPRTQPTLTEVQAAEVGLDHDALVAESLARSERVPIHAPERLVVAAAPSSLDRGTWRSEGK
jgi:thiamine biosynthesis protein ThiI